MHSDARPSTPVALCVTEKRRFAPPNLYGVGCRLVSPLLPYPRVLSYLHRTLQECIAESGGSSKEATLTLALRMEEPGAKQAIEDLRDLMKMEPEVYEAEKLQDEWIADFQNQVDYVPGETGRGSRQKRDGGGREWRVGLNPAVLSTSEDGSKHKTLRVYEHGLRVLCVCGVRAEQGQAASVGGGDGAVRDVGGRDEGHGQQGIRSQGLRDGTHTLHTGATHRRRGGLVVRSGQGRWVVGTPD